MATPTKTPKTPKFDVCKDGRKWHVTKNGKPIETFTTKREALAELNACRADYIEPPVVPVLTHDEIEAMDQTERLKIAKAETQATRDWKASGMVGPAPARPVLNFLADPHRPKAKPKTPGRSRVELSKTDADELMAAVKNIRQAGNGWHKTADVLAETTELRRPDGTVWRHHQLYAIAKQRGELKV